MQKNRLLFILLSWSVLSATAQQVPDTLFEPSIGNPAYSRPEGPVVLPDGAHHNFHTAEGRYHVFARILVIANALNKDRSLWTDPKPEIRNNFL
jgi:hypothetical protein